MARMKQAEPKAIYWLVEQVGRAEAGEHLSVSPGALGQYLKDNSAPEVIEKLARRMQEDHESKNGHRLLFVRVPHPKLDLVMTFLKGAGVKFMQFEDRP